MEAFEVADVDDPFINITENSLHIADGVINKKKKKSKFGKMIPFNACGKVWNIGPDYKFFIGAFSFISIAGTALILGQIHFNASPWFTITSIVINLIQILSYLSVFFSNPGIAIESVSSSINSDVRYCPDCQIYTSKTTYHCQDCNVCILQLDHHCPWTSKCIGKNNIIRFYVFLFATMIALLYDVVALPISLAPAGLPQATIL